jgi:hypothetical protein
MMVASAPTAAGAADNALAIISASVVGGATGPVAGAGVGSSIVISASMVSTGSSAGPLHPTKSKAPSTKAEPFTA